MISKSQSSIQRQPVLRPFSTSRTCQAGLLLLLGAVLSAGCVSKEQYEAEKVRGLNFQRLLAQEEKRANTLNAQLAQKDKEINKLNAQLKETNDKIAALESQNRNLTTELDTLRGQSHRLQEQEPAPDSPALSQDPNTSKTGPLSDPFMSEEELMNMLGREKPK